MDRKKILLFFIIIIFFLFSFSFIFKADPILLNSNNALNLVTKAHSPIYIDGNQDLNDTSDSGYGNSTHPFIIEDKIIIGGTSTGIYIVNTNLSFIVRNCTILTGHNGIFLGDVSNGQIEDCKVQDITWSGIGLWGCNNSKVLRNSVKNDRSYGIFIYITRNCTVQENYIEFASNGFYIYSNFNCTIVRNMVTYSQALGFDIVGVENSTIDGNVADYNSFGMQLVFCSHCNITSNIIRHNLGYGLRVGNCLNALIACDPE